MWSRVALDHSCQHHISKKTPPWNGFSAGQKK